MDAVSARAFAHLPRTLELAKVWLEQGAVGLFPAGPIRQRANRRDEFGRPTGSRLFQRD